MWGDPARPNRTRKRLGSALVVPETEVIAMNMTAPSNL